MQTGGGGHGQGEDQSGQVGIPGVQGPDCQLEAVAGSVQDTHQGEDWSLESREAERRSLGGWLQIVGGNHEHYRTQVRQRFVGTWPLTLKAFSI